MTGDARPGARGAHCLPGTRPAVRFLIFWGSLVRHEILRVAASQLASQCTSSTHTQLISVHLNARSLLWMSAKGVRTGCHWHRAIWPPPPLGLGLDRDTTPQRRTLGQLRNPRPIRLLARYPSAAVAGTAHWRAGLGGWGWALPGANPRPGRITARHNKGASPAPCLCPSRFKRNLSCLQWSVGRCAALPKSSDEVAECLRRAAEADACADVFEDRKRKAENR